MLNLYRNFSIAIFTRSVIAKDGIAKKIVSQQGLAMLMLGLALLMMPLGAHAAGISGLLSNLGTTVRDGVDFVMLVAVLVGVGAIFYGCKLIVDKSNDRENVKNGHIAMSFIGGAALCILWFVVTMLTESVGDGQIGQAASF